MKNAPSGKSGRAWLLRSGWVLALLVFAGFGQSRLTAEDQKKGEFRGELQKLRGAWVVKSIISDGKPIRDTYTYTFSERSYILEWPKAPLNFEPPQLKFDFELDSTGQFKVIWKMEPGEGRDDSGARAQIYRFQGEKLEICYHVAKQRWRTPPDKFDAAAGSGRQLITLERVKPEAPKK